MLLLESCTLRSLCTVVNTERRLAAWREAREPGVLLCVRGYRELDHSVYHYVIDPTSVQTQTVLLCLG